MCMHYYYITLVHSTDKKEKKTKNQERNTERVRMKSSGNGIEESRGQANAIGMKRKK